jgi:hypothetical protein
MKSHKSQFSQREGYLPVPEALQLEELPRTFRLEIELCLTKAIELYQHEERFAIGKKKAARWEIILRDLWVQFLNQPLSQYLGMYQVQEGLIRIVHHGEFYEVFDVIEELINRTMDDQPQFYKDVKTVFERRRLAYRLVGSNSIGYVIVPTMNEHEVVTANTTFDLLSLKAGSFDSVLKHLMNAGQLLREGKDSKSISESTSAVESTFRILVGNNKEHNVVAEEYFKSANLHPVIKKHIGMPYQFASDISDGRHSTKEAGYNADQFDAQYIFTICCSIIQYLINKKGANEVTILS